MRAYAAPTAGMIPGRMKPHLRRGTTTTTTAAAAAAGGGKASSGTSTSRRRRAALLAAACGLAGVALIGHVNILGSSVGRVGKVGVGGFRNKAKAKAKAGSAATATAREDGQGPYLGRHLSASPSENGGESTGTTTTSATTRTPPRKRLAIVRPFGVDGAADVSASFDTWDPLWPCTSTSPSTSTSSNGNGEPSEDDEEDYEYDVDLFLSFSRTYDSALYPDAVRTMSSLRSKFESNRGWYGCFSNLYAVEADVPAEWDLYARDHVQLDRHWVNGPNSQFRSIMDAVMVRNVNAAGGTGAGGGEYELVLILEADARVQTVGWLDAILEEVAEKRPFAILGSKYKGHSWDNFKDELSVSLREHINGNAVYNISHPLTTHLISELQAESQTLFNAIPFDYRISQIVTEGRLGIPPEFPFPEMKDDANGRDSIVLPTNTPLFKSWWDDYGGGGDQNPMKESNVITNFAATNYLPEHLTGYEPIVHGKGAFAPWDGRLHQITLVVTDWNEDFARTILSNLDSSDHPFAEVVVMREPESSVPFAAKSFWGLVWDMVTPSVTSTVPFEYRVREEGSADFMDLCNAPVKTEWFMLTNSYHKVVSDVDLMFTHDDPPKPLIPYTPANSKHCTDYAACRETFALGQEMYPDLDRVILDLDMVYHTQSRNAFCDSWKEENGASGEKHAGRVGGGGGGIEAYLQGGIPRGPTATSYLAYLYSSGMADNIYAFTNRLDHGAKDAFVKVHGEAEAERHLAVNGGAYHRALSSSEENGNNHGFFSEWWSRSFGRSREDNVAKLHKEEKAPATTKQPSFVQRFKKWWSKDRDSEEGEKGEDVVAVDAIGVVEDNEQHGGASTAGLAAERAVKQVNAQCAEAGTQAKTCGAKGNLPNECCTGFVCGDGGSCVVASYGGGEVARGLSLTAPGLLAHN